MVDAGAVLNPAYPLQKSEYWLFWCLVNERRDPGVGVHPNASPVSLLIRVRSLVWWSHRCFLIQLKMCSELKFKMHLLVESRGNQLLMDLLRPKTCERVGGSHLTCLYEYFIGVLRAPLFAIWTFPNLCSVYTECHVCNGMTYFSSASGVTIRIWP
jgi:hypothetical protein